MHISLGERLVGRPPNLYTPSDGFENFLGNNPIRVLKIETPILEIDSKIKSLQVLHLEMKSGFTRRIALLEDFSGEKAAAYFYQDDFEPKREKNHDGKPCLGYTVFGDTATIGQIRVVSSTPKNNINRDLFVDADQLAFRLATDSKNTDLKGNDYVRLSGSGAVVVTDLDRDKFLESESIQQAIGELFKKDGVFKNNYILPGISNNQFITNIKKYGAAVLYGTNNVPDIQNLFHKIFSMMNEDMRPKIRNKLFDKTVALFGRIPWLEKLYEDPETQIKFNNITEFIVSDLLVRIREEYIEIPDDIV